MNKGVQIFVMDLTGLGAGKEPGAALESAGSKPETSKASPAAPRSWIGPRN
jgi:hypothetical protein